jgi:hypothetical protein
MKLTREKVEGFREPAAPTFKQQIKGNERRSGSSKRSAGQDRNIKRSTGPSKEAKWERDGNGSPGNEQWAAARGPARTSSINGTTSNPTTRGQEIER